MILMMWNLLKLCYSLNVCVPLKLCWNLTAQCDDIKRWELGKYLGHEGGTLMSEISTLIKEVPGSLLVPLCLFSISIPFIISTLSILNDYLIICSIQSWFSKPHTIMSLILKNKGILITLFFETYLLLHAISFLKVWKC